MKKIFILIASNLHWHKLLDLRAPPQSEVTIKIQMVTVMLFLRFTLQTRIHTRQISTSSLHETQLLLLICILLLRESYTDIAIKPHRVRSLKRNNIYRLQVLTSTTAIAKKRQNKLAYLQPAMNKITGYKIIT